jgi:hypothetical protein
MPLSKHIRCVVAIFRHDSKAAAAFILPLPFQGKGKRRLAKYVSYAEIMT